MASEPGKVLEFSETIPYSVLATLYLSSFPLQPGQQKARGSTMGEFQASFSIPSAPSPPYCLQTRSPCQLAQLPCPIEGLCGMTSVLRSGIQGTVEGGRKAQHTNRDERSHAGISSSSMSSSQALMNQWLPWVPGDTLPSARPGHQSEPRTAHCRAGGRLHA